MHILAIQDGAIDTGDEAIDLAQSPGDIVVLSSADSELALLARAYADWRPADGSAKPTLRLANVLTLRHNYSVDLYIENTVASAKLIVVRAMGGKGYWPYGLEQIERLCRTGMPDCAIIPGDSRPDPSLLGLSTVPDEAIERLWRCLAEGGPANAAMFLDVCNAFIRHQRLPDERPMPFPNVGLLQPTARIRPQRAGHAALIFYRALVQAGDLEPVHALAEALQTRGLTVDPIYVSSLRDPDVAGFLIERFAEMPPDVMLNATAFASGTAIDSGAGDAETFGSNAPWLQVVFSGQSADSWEKRSAGLPTRDIAMHVAMPEFDGRLLTRAVAFKEDRGRDLLTELHITGFAPQPDRVAFVADLAAAWVRLKNKARSDRKIAIILPNYPNRDSRLANGVGLDTPASAVALMKALASAGYDTVPPANSAELMDVLRAGVTNAPGSLSRPRPSVMLSLGDYAAQFSLLSSEVRSAVEKQWGAPDDDPFVCAGVFRLPMHTFGNIAIGIQPARGYNIDPKATYHDPALVPPHGYFATYFWLRHVFGVDAVIHLGKHGNLEWLPGKALALSRACLPEAALGPVPNIYPFIVNDPGEGAQAKRRTSAVIVDHLTPPLTRAETYGPLREIETRLDEYYDALTLDPRRAEKLAVEIVRAAERTGLAADCGIDVGDNDPARLQKLDAYLCDLKEMQIRGGLHILGRSPTGSERTDLLAAIVRIPRSEHRDGGSLQRAIAADLHLSDGALGPFDPLDCDFSRPWDGPRPEILQTQSADPWRTAGDTVERIELLAAKLIDGTALAPMEWTRTRSILSEIAARIAPALDRSGALEIAATLAALDGRAIPPGPSGAPTRGRIDVLPTGRNFYSLDSRTLPTPTAWELGRKSAEAVIERYTQDHGDWPRAIALSAWGTSNMRTGGDDIAQALALMGAKPKWEPTSGRVIGYEIIPLAKLSRPRVDVTLRISGFFRDAFPQQIALLDTAVRAVAELDEGADDNPLRAQVEMERQELVASGVSAVLATRQATFRIFGSQPGAYGAGLQALFDERIWDTEDDLADAFLTWGGFAYGSDTPGAPAREGLEKRLARTDAVLHNQDNREHDILDSDDYYQFAGGLAVAARALGGAQVPVYHSDHSRPEKPIIRSLDEEVARVVRARAVNPKWINAMMMHGYKGAFEMAATVDYLFAFAVTTHAVRDHHFDAVFDAYLADDQVRRFLEEANPDALVDIAAKLQEAIDRNIWTPHRNSAHQTLTELAQRQPNQDAKPPDVDTEETTP